MVAVMDLRGRYVCRPTEIVNVGTLGGGSVNCIADCVICFKHAVPICDLI